MLRIIAVFVLVIFSELLFNVKQVLMFVWEKFYGVINMAVKLGSFPISAIAVALVMTNVLYLFISVNNHNIECNT